MVKLGDNGRPDDVVGGFSDVSGLGNEVKYSEYRNGNEPVNHVRKIANTNSTDDVTLKRGLIGDTSLFEWLKRDPRGAFDPRTVPITLLDEARRPVCSWKLLSAQPKKWVGPDAGRQGRRRGGHGGAAPRRRADRLLSSRR